MKRFSLRWILLWPILFTVSIGISALAVYVERTARSDQIAAVDDELTRVGQSTADGPPIGPPGDDSDLPPTRPDGDADAAEPGVVADVGGRRHSSLPSSCLVRNVVDDVTASHPDHRIETQRDAEAILSVTGDRARLHQCILNLVANACRHGGDHVEVMLGSADEPRSATVSVVDHGDGISAELTEKVFLPFYRGDKSRARDGRGGAGLGLALAKQIAEEHEGNITIQPTDGGGATFTLTVPTFVSLADRNVSTRTRQPRR